MTEHVRFERMHDRNFQGRKIVQTKYKLWVVELSPSIRICTGGNSEASDHLALLLASLCAVQLIFFRWL